MRHVLADFILNVPFPDDWYTIVVSFLAIYITWKLLRFSLGMVAAILRPFVASIILLVSSTRQRMTKSFQNNLKLIRPFPSLLSLSNQALLSFALRFSQCMNWKEIATCAAAGSSGVFSHVGSMISYGYEQVQLVVRSK